MYLFAKRLILVVVGIAAIAISTVLFTTGPEGLHKQFDKHVLRSERSEYEVEQVLQGIVEAVRSGDAERGLSFLKSLAQRS